MKQPAPAEITATPEMIEAGAKVLLTSGDENLRQLGWIYAELVATEVIQAALAVHNKHLATVKA